MKNILFLLLFLCTFFFSCKKESTKDFTSNKNIDSLLIKASQTIDTKAKLNIAEQVFNKLEADDLDSISRIQYMSLARIYLSLNNVKYVKICESLILNPSIPYNHNEISFSNFILGIYYYGIADYEKSFFYLTKAEKSFSILKDQYYLCYVINTKADILTFKNDYNGAEILSIKSLKIAKELKKEDLIYSNYLTLGNSLTGLNNYEKAIFYYIKAIEITNKLKSNPKYLELRVMPYNYIALVYQKKKDYYKSIKIINEALKFDNFKNNNSEIYCYLTNNLAYSKFKLGDKSSLNQFQETLQIANSKNSLPVQITSKTYLGEYYLAEKDTIKANFYLKDAQVQAHKNDIFEDELKILQLLAKANPIEENFYSNRYIQLTDSLHNVERATRDKFARIAFETDEITTQKNVVDKKNNQLLNSIWFLLGIGSLSIISIYLIYKNQSQKAKTRELLLKQEQQKANVEIYQLMLAQQQKIEEGKNSEKQRISLELHDGVMGKLSAVRLNLYALLYKANLVQDVSFSLQIDEIQAVEKEIRTIAHDLNSNLFSDNSNFIAIVKELFAKIENHSQLQFALDVSQTVNWDLINTTIKINLYRILQEALQNIEKYANAKKVTVTMKETDFNKIEITILDDGNGFDTSQIKEGIGIKNMKVRIAELNGKFEITSQRNIGTKINLIIPF